MIKGALRPFRVEGNIAYIQLTKGYEAMIDAADLPLVEANKWFAQEAYYRDGSVRAVYVVRQIRINGKITPIRLHRVITEAEDGFEVDHINGNGLDNRRENLRVCSKAQNQHNARRRSDNKSGFKGVRWYPKYQKWNTSIRLNGKSKNLGYFRCPTAAAVAYAKASAELHGDFGRT